MRLHADDLVILPEIEATLFPLSPDEAAHLTASLLAEGIRDPLVVWPRDGQRVLVDGHHRYRIATQHGLPFAVVERPFATLEEALDWIDRNQLGRRNLTDEQRAVVIGRIYERRKRGWGGDRRSRAQIDPLKQGPHATAKRIAAEFGVKQATVRRAAAFARAMEQIEAVSPEAARVILQGQVTDALTRCGCCDGARGPNPAGSV